MTENNSIQTVFHPIVCRWFQEHVGEPTDIQREAWSSINEEKHSLIIAPTGSGKTFAAFLYALDRLLTGKWTGSSIKVLYVSPLKALNNDIRKNLMSPLEGLGTAFEQEGELYSDIQIQVRSGDTPQSERRKILRRPPEILITTPESLNILLTSKNGAALFSGLKTVIMDEIHAVAGGKRGAHFITAVERLTLISGEFLRIALSATVNPPEEIAAFAAGYVCKDQKGDPVYLPRSINIIEGRDTKNIRTIVAFPENVEDEIEEGTWWPVLIREFLKITERNRSTIFFVNSRRLSEKISRLMNEQAGHIIAYSHHGSLAKEIRLFVEEKLKAGELKCIVATSSLELGIDIGELDEVVLVQTPFSVSSAMQKIGRGGHRVDRESRGVFSPTHGRDFIDAAVMARAVSEKNIEPIHIPKNPLDVLAQVILSMTAFEEWHRNRLFAFIKSAYPYRELTEKLFESVLEMLEGRYGPTRIQELKARVYYDRIHGTVKAMPNVPLLLYMSGGTIPDRGLFNIKTGEGGARIGQLDEEFVWERNIGETFAFGPQTWKISSISHNDVIVEPTKRRAGIIPFWKGEDNDRGRHFSSLLINFMDHAADMMRDRIACRKELIQCYHMDSAAAERLIGFLHRQIETTGEKLPGSRNVLVETIVDRMETSDLCQVVIHNFWGGSVNRPFSMALAAAYEKQYGYCPEIYSGNDAVILMVPDQVSGSDLFSLIPYGDVENYVRQGLWGTGFFGAHFRENAGRALLLPKTGFDRRLPLWINRLRSRKLYEAVKNYDAFPILLETWRSCLSDSFDLPCLKEKLKQIDEGTISLVERETSSPSPLSAGLMWRQVNLYMYKDDTPGPDAAGGYRNTLIDEVMGRRDLWPEIPNTIISTVSRKLACTAPGYSPGTPEELDSLIKDRVVLTEKEWGELSEAVLRDHERDITEIVNEAKGNILCVNLSGEKGCRYLSAEMFPSFASAAGLNLKDVSFDTPGCNTGNTSGNVADYIMTVEEGNNCQNSDVIYQWVMYRGTVCTEELQYAFTLEKEQAVHLLEELLQRELITILPGESDTVLYSTRKNMESFLRLYRKERRESFASLPQEELSAFRAFYTGIAGCGASVPELKDIMDMFLYCPERCELWEEAVLPVRIPDYNCTMLDELFELTDVQWYGRGKKTVYFGFPAEGLLASKDCSGSGENMLPDTAGYYSFFDIQKKSGLDSGECAGALWEAAWRGEIHSDSFAVARKGVLNSFKVSGKKNESPGARSFKRWKSRRPLEGKWRSVPPEGDENIIEDKETKKERVRQLLKRHGVLSRELLKKEAEPFRWKSLFRTMRIMEFSGELTGGLFFEGVSGPQFTDSETLKLLAEYRGRNEYWFINAADPASLCGTGIKLQNLPPAVPGTWIIYRGSEIRVLVKGNGSSLEFFGDPSVDDINALKSLSLFLTNRDFRPLRGLTVEKINGENARGSIFEMALSEAGFKKDRETLVFYRDVM